MSKKKAPMLILHAKFVYGIVLCFNNMITHCTDMQQQKKRTTTEKKEQKQTKKKGECQNESWQIEIKKSKSTLTCSTKATKKASNVKIEKKSTNTKLHRMRLSKKCYKKINISKRIKSTME